MSRGEARRRLVAHPDFPCDAVDEVEVALAIDDGRLVLAYRVVGRIDALRLPASTAAARADELWRHSCFEAFLLTSPRYLEFNLSPSHQWAAYQFDDYRRGMRDLAIPAPDIASDRGEGEFRLSCTIEGLPAIARVGVSAILQSKDGSISYWALAHPAGPPDFHHPDCFALDLSAMGSP